MLIEFNCTQCQTTLRVDDSAAGRQVRCPKCSAVLMAPSRGTQYSPATPAESTRVGPTVMMPADPNPYASPSLAATPDAGKIPPLRGGPLEVGYVLSRTWEIFKIHWPLCLVATLVPGGIQQGLGIVLQMAIKVLAPVSMGAAIVVGIALYLGAVVLIIWLNVGQFIFMLRVADGETPDIANLFRGGPWIVRLFLLWIVLMLAFYGVLILTLGVPLGIGALAGLAGAKSGTAGIALGLVVGGAIGVVLFFMLATAWSQCIYVLIDQNAGVFESLRLSWQLTQGNRMAILGVFLTLVVINIGGFLACCIGILGTAPFSMLALAVMHTALARTAQT
jgi:predicted Zn finger-like uncharacterized protein